MKTLKEIVKKYGDIEFYLSSISVPTYKEKTSNELCADFHVYNNRGLSVDSGILWAEVSIDTPMGQERTISLREMAKYYSIIGIVVDTETYPNEDLINVGQGCGYIYLVK